LFISEKKLNLFTKLVYEQIGEVLQSVKKLWSASLHASLKRLVS